MPLGFKSVDGLSHSQADTGIPIGSIPGDPGGPVSIAVLTALGFGLPPSDGSIVITLYPNGSHTQSGTDGSGNISVQVTLTNSGDDKTFAMSGGGNITLDSGLWAQLIRGNINNATGTRGFDIQFLVYEAGDFTESLVDTPDSLQASDISYDPDAGTDGEGTVDLSFSYDNSSAEDPVSFVINRDDGSGPVFVGYIPWVDGVTDYTYTDYVFGPPADYTYTIQAYKYGPNVISPVSNAVVVSFSGTIPDINVTGGQGGVIYDEDGNIIGGDGSGILGGLDLGGAATIVFITDPSGIYTLVPGQKHDRLYQRTADEYVDVKIPDPFARTSFIGE